MFLLQGVNVQDFCKTGRVTKIFLTIQNDLILDNDKAVQKTPPNTAAPAVSRHKSPTHRWKLGVPLQKMLTLQIHKLLI